MYLLMQTEAFEFPTLRTLPYFVSNSEENRFIELIMKMPHSLEDNIFKERGKLLCEVNQADWFAGSFRYNDPMSTILYNDYEKSP